MCSRGGRIDPGLLNFLFAYFDPDIYDLGYDLDMVNKSWQSVQSDKPVRIVVSTPNGVDNSFAKLMRDGKVDSENLHSKARWWQSTEVQHHDLTVTGPPVDS